MQYPIGTRTIYADSKYAWTGAGSNFGSNAAWLFGKVRLMASDGVGCRMSDSFRKGSGLSTSKVKVNSR